MEVSRTRTVSEFMGNGKPNKDSIRKLYALMKHNDKYGDLLQTMAGYCYVLQKLTGKQATFSELFNKYGDRPHSYKQWAMLYAIGKQKDFDFMGYIDVVKDIIL